MKRSSRNLQLLKQAVMQMMMMMNCEVLRLTRYSLAGFHLISADLTPVLMKKFIRHEGNMKPVA